ncbi:MAG: patatin-like phospholipase family protein [Rikenellaceae bacterium]|nr:patatin-like phospholipase family protein [Rikenellaceae bacterium]
MDKCVSLALSSGGPRGFAYIGAIEELTSRGYRIGSVAGTSIGSLVGGIYAAGKLDEFKEWLFALDAWKVFTLMDLSIGKNHIVKGERIIEAMREIVPDVDIESLPIPFRAVATDLYTGEEVVFDHGKLFEAIRASISIPSLFQPVKHGLTTLVDGCIANCLPLSRVVRTEGDILVAFDVNDVDVAEIRSILTRENAALVADTAFEQSTRAEMRGILDSVTNRSDIGLVERLKSAGSRSMSLIKDVINYEEEYDETKALDYGDTYYDLLDRSFSLMNHRQSELSIALYKPDIVVKMPFDAYGEIADYAKAKEISEIGRQLMREALDRYEGK